MPIIIPIILILFSWLSAADCSTAYTHKHDRLKDVEVVISSWSGCAVTGTINGVSTPLFMDVAGCPLHAKLPGRFRIRFDQSCGAILEITDGPAILTPMPVSCPTPTPTPVPTPTPEPTPNAPSCVLTAPASATVPKNSTGSVSVTVQDLVTTVNVSSKSSSPGQVSVSPALRSVTPTSAIVAFSLRAKKQGARITFSSPCGTASTAVTVR